MAIPSHRQSHSDRAWLARDREVLAPVLGRMTDIVAVRGGGAWLTSADGRRYLDLTSGIAVTTLGHCHPEVVEAVTRQASELVHTSVVAHHPRSIELAERLCGTVPYIPGAQVFFCNTGAEAVDGALKLARRITGKPGVIAFQGAFHGRTMAATSLTTAKPKYQRGYEPLLAGVRVAPYANPLRYGGRDEAARWALAALDDVLFGASDIGAVIVEPVLGEGGYVVPPAAWLAGLRDRCDAHGALLVFDEVQTGVGRTGRFFAAETFRVRPDVVLFAKGIASGLPLGGIIASRELMARWPTGTHGSTFGGNPVSCAAALATLDVVERDDLCRRVRTLGPHALDVLRVRAAGNDAVLEVRGLGFMIGVELATGAACARVRKRCLDRGVIVIACGPEDSVIRVIPPLTIADEELELGLNVLADALDGEARFEGS